MKCISILYYIYKMKYSLFVPPGYQKKDWTGVSQQLDQRGGALQVPRCKTNRFKNIYHDNEHAVLKNLSQLKVFFIEAVTAYNGEKIILQLVCLWQ